MQFSVTGRGFDNIPNNAVAVIDTPTDPLGNRYSDDPSAVMNIVRKTDTSMEFSTSDVYTYGIGHSLGAILSANRNIVYWAKE